MRRNLLASFCLVLMFLAVGCQQANPIVSPSPTETIFVPPPSFSGGTPPPDPYIFRFRRVATACTSGVSVLRVPIQVDQWVSGLALSITVIIPSGDPLGASITSCYLESNNANLVGMQPIADQSSVNYFLYKLTGTIPTGQQYIRITINKSAYIGASAVTVTACDPNNVADHWGGDQGNLEDYTNTWKPMGGDVGNLLVVFGLPQSSQTLQGTSTRVSQYQPMSGVDHNTFIDTCDGSNYNYLTLNSDEQAMNMRISWIQFHPDPNLQSPVR